MLNSLIDSVHKEAQKDPEDMASPGLWSRMKKTTHRWMIPARPKSAAKEPLASHRAVLPFC